MVAYSFQKRFAPQIAAYEKLHTIRGHRKRHARPGEDVQLYQGMRTRYCQKIVPDPRCTAALPILIRFRRGLIHSVAVDSVPVGDLDAFAVLDGFENRDDMSAFWAATHNVQDDFSGVMICWQRKPELMRCAA